MSKTYAPLPFSYLTGGNAPENTPTYGVKTSTSHDDSLENVSPTDNDPYSIYAGKANQPTHAQVSSRKSMDVTESHMDVSDPYLLSMGRLSKEKGSTQDNNITDDPRYRDSVPSESEGGNVFFRPPEGGSSDNVFNVKSSHGPGPEAYQAPPVQRPAYTNPTLDNMTGDEDTLNRAGKKLPRYRVGTDSGYQFYSGNEGPKTQNQDMLSVPNQGRGPSPTPNKGMDNANNPIWDKYYAGNPPAGYDAYPPNSPVSPGIRPTTKQDDFNTLIRNSGSSDSYNKQCCKSKKCAVITAIFVTAIICLGAGFAAGWFIFQVVNPEAGSEMTTTTTITTAGTVAGVISTTMPPGVTTRSVTTTRTPPPQPTTTTTSTTRSSTTLPETSSVSTEQTTQEVVTPSTP